jgi:hypothetical protein
LSSACRGYAKLTFQIHRVNLAITRFLLSALAVTVAYVARQDILPSRSLSTTSHQRYLVSPSLNTGVHQDLGVECEFRTHQHRGIAHQMVGHRQRLPTPNHEKNNATHDPQLISSISYIHVITRGCIPAQVRCICASHIPNNFPWVAQAQVQLCVLVLTC